MSWVELLVFFIISVVIYILFYGIIISGIIIFVGWVLGIDVIELVMQWR